MGTFERSKQAPKFGSYQSKFFGPDFVPNMRKHLEERLRTGSKYLELCGFFLEKFASFKTALTRLVRTAKTIREGISLFFWPQVMIPPNVLVCKPSYVKTITIVSLISSTTYLHRAGELLIAETATRQQDFFQKNISYIQVQCTLGRKYSRHRTTSIMVSPSVIGAWPICTPGRGFCFSECTHERRRRTYSCFVAVNGFDIKLSLYRTLIYRLCTEANGPEVCLWWSNDVRSRQCIIFFRTTTSGSRCQRGT